jgi:RimJ/RimL family protein N-acetyltransferase
MGVRKATILDMAWIFVELGNFDKFSKYGLFEDNSYTRKLFLEMVNGHVFFVTDEKDGFIAGTISAHPYNPNKTVLYENFWWVKPEARGKKSGLELLNAFTEHGKKIADYVVMTLEHDSPVNDRCLLSRGYKKAETNYLLRSN